MPKPEKVFKMGAVRASIFRNIIERDGKSIPLAKVIIEVRYKDKSGEWKGTNSLSLNEWDRFPLYTFVCLFLIPGNQQPFMCA